jgi:DNA-directed RNA polymerase specialized sigma24 family protein
MGYTGSADGAAQPPDGGEPARPGSRPVRRPLRHRAGLQSGGTALPPLESLYRAHYTALVRLAALLTGDAVLAESVAADSMAALLSGALGSRPPEPHLFWLQRQVVVRSRRAARFRPAGTGAGGSGASGTAATASAGTRSDGTGSDGTGSGPAAVPAWGSAPVVGGLAALPAGQREAVVLRHYLELTDEETAAVMGASLRAVRRNLNAGRLALAPVLPAPEGPPPAAAGHS